MLKNFLYFFSLEKGARMIGLNDVITLLVEVILAILCLKVPFFRTYFRLPVDQNHAWLIAAQLLIIELTRVLAFGYLLKSNPQSSRPRLVMFLTRVSTLFIQITLLTYAFYTFGIKSYILVLLANVFLFILDTYFSLVLLSYYL